MAAGFARMARLGVFDILPAVIENARWRRLAGFGCVHDGIA